MSTTENTVRTVCFECHSRCGVFLHIKDGRIESIEGDKSHPISEGFICPKGRAVKEIVYHPDISVWHKVGRYRFSNRFMRRRAFYEGVSKAMFNSLEDYNRGADMATEQDLLKRIAFRLIPESLLLLIRHPIIALKRIWIAKFATSCVAIGFLSYKIRNLFGRREATKS